MLRQGLGDEEHGAPQKPSIYHITPQTRTLGRAAASVNLKRGFKANFCVRARKNSVFLVRQLHSAKYLASLQKTNGERMSDVQNPAVEKSDLRGGKKTTFYAHSPLSSACNADLPIAVDKPIAKLNYVDLHAFVGL